MKSLKHVIAIFLILGISYSFKNSTKVNIWMVGDSTMAQKSDRRYPESGWGASLSDYVNNKAIVHNHAASGRSTLSFIKEKRWKTVCDSLKKGDYVIIQFGHNDEKTNPKLYTKPFGSFSLNLKTIIDESREKGAIPIVCSSIVRRQFNNNGELIDTHGDYIKATKAIAIETKTPYVDMELLTRRLVTDMGQEKSKEIYNFTNHKQDSTHLNLKGASVVAGLFVDDVKVQRLKIRKLFK